MFDLRIESCGEQCVGNITEYFGSRWDNYKSDVRKAESGNMEMTQKFLSSYFLQRDHQSFLKDVEVRLIDKAQASDPTKRSFTG